MPRRPILAALLIAAITTLGVLLFARVGGDGDDQRVAVGRAAPGVAGTTLDGSPFDLAALAGRPVVINFWGPSCVPCRDEFPLLAAKLSEHAADGLAVVGVLTDDPPEPARDFVAEYGATWPTVLDPDKLLKAAYRVAARPQTYFVDPAGIVRSIQIGELTDADFERQYQRIAPARPAALTGGLALTGGPAACARRLRLPPAPDTSPGSARESKLALFPQIVPAYEPQWCRATIRPDSGESYAAAPVVYYPR